MNPEMPTNCLPAELVARAGFLLGRLGIALKTQTMDAFEHEGFSAYHYSILALLEEGARTTQAGVADALGMDASMLVSLLDGLEDRGLVERKRDPNDRRRQTVTMTAAGRRQLAAFRKLVQKIEDEFLAPLGEDERQELHDLLLKVAEHRDARFVVRTVARA
jgi:DNA-binding MarR family transcriptional regulator